MAAPTMHAIAFNLKRAFHSFLNLTRRPFRILELTAARFDMLHVINGAGAYGMRQSQLRRVLGVTAATVCRMVRSLEKLGCVTRERERYERRQIRLKITALGRRLVRRAWAQLSGDVDLAFDSALTDGRAWDERECFEQMSCSESHLWNVRGAFGDRASLHYAWHPDD